MKQVILKDVIKITDEDILNALSFTLYKLKYDEALDLNEKAYEDFINKFFELLTQPQHYKVLAFDSQQDQYNYHLNLMKELFNNWRDKYYLTDLFLVIDVQMDYFKVGLLNDSDYNNFRSRGVLKEVLDFLSVLKFPHSEQMKTFYKMGVAFKKEDIIKI